MNIYLISLLLISSFLTLMSEAADVVDGNYTQLLACVFSEGGSDSLYYNYDRSEAAVDLAISYANYEILHPLGLELSIYYPDPGPVCSSRNGYGSVLMDMIQRGLKCDIFLGPGEISHFDKSRFF